VQKDGIATESSSKRNVRDQVLAAEVLKGELEDVMGHLRGLSGETLPGTL